MVIRLTRFNTYLLAAALGVMLAGCATPNSKRNQELATLRVHVEVNRIADDRSEAVTVSRAAQIKVNVDKDPILNEGDVAEARIVDGMGGFTLLIQFERRGIMILEQFSAINPGKRFAIAAQWGVKQKGKEKETAVQSRWLAAPVIARRIGDGVLRFTPDATRAEAEEIVRGLNNVAIENGNQEKPKKQKKEEAKTP